MARINPISKRDMSLSRNLDLPLRNIDFSNFKGINNVDDALNLADDELAEASNVDIDNRGKIQRRNGYTKKYTPTGVLHSLWSNDRICLFVDGTSLMRLYEDYSSTVVRSNVTTLPMSYVDVNEKIYYSNASVNGYIENGLDVAFSDPGIKFKQAPKPGQHIEFYNGRLYIARNETIWYTDAYALGRVDMRSNFISMKDEVTMLKAVDDGIYVSIGDINDRSSVIFLGGSTPEEFTYKVVADYGAIEGTAVKPKSAFIGDGIEGQTVLWTSRKGICLGANGGRLTNLTAQRYVVPNNRFGAGLFRLQNGIPQYIASLWT